MKISQVTLKVAAALSSCSTFALNDFFLHAKPGQIFDFCHYNFYYSYPEWGYQWKDEKLLQFHQVHTSCSKCPEQPARNYAGIGSFYLCIQENRKASLLCDDCAEGLQVFREVERLVQMRLF